MVKKMTKNIKNDKTIDYCDVIINYMTSYVINFILLTFKLPYNEDFLICENSSSYMNKVKPIEKVIKISSQYHQPSKSYDIFYIREDDSSPPGQIGLRDILLKYFQSIKSYYL